ncbi:2642_t:CDS:2, partial [Racocetra fulgida]
NKELNEKLEKCIQERKPLEEANAKMQKALKKCDEYYTALDKKANIILDNFIVQYESTSDLEIKINKIGAVKNENLQNIDEKCKKLTEENEKLIKENKELTEKNDELVYFVYKKQNKYQQMNKEMTELFENLDKKIDNSLIILKINFIFSDSNINKINKIVLASENLKKIQQ